MSNGSEEVILHALFPERFTAFKFFNTRIFNERSFLVVSLQNSFVNTYPGLTVVGQSFRQSYVEWSYSACYTH